MFKSYFGPLSRAPPDQEKKTVRKLSLSIIGIVSVLCLPAGARAQEATSSPIKGRWALDLPLSGLKPYFGLSGGVRFLESNSPNFTVPAAGVALRDVTFYDSSTVGTAAAVLDARYDVGGIAILTAATLAGPAGAQAQGGPAPKPSTPPSVARGTDHFDLSVGSGVVLSPRPYVGASEAAIAIPAVNIRYKWLFAEGIRGGAQFLRQGKLAGNVYLQANFDGLKADDSPYLAGMETRSKSADAGLEVVYRARPVGFRVNVLTDVLGRNDGQEFSAQAVTGAPLGSRGFLLASIGPRWISANRVDYYYGVRESEARPNRPAYTGTSSWNWDLSLGATVRIAGKWSAFVLFSRKAFGNPIEQSPIVDRTAGYSLISSFTYTLR
jgi:outer membrane protein